MLLIGYWLVFLGLIREFGTTSGQNYPLLPTLLLAWVVFGVWRINKRRRAKPVE